MRLIPDSVKAGVRRAHHALGHCWRASLLRLAKASKKSEDHLFYIRHWQCSACMSRKVPEPIARASVTARPQEFNKVVGVDLKFVKDSKGVTYTFLNVLDVATRKSGFYLVPSKSSRHVSEKFLDKWCSWAGVPAFLIHDQGGEFFKDFQTACRAYGIQTNCTATESPWQNALVERHGAVLGTIVEMMAERLQLEGEDQMRMAGHFATMAKDRRPDKFGHSARSRVFGTEERFPGSTLDALLEGENPVEMQECLEDPVFRRSVRMRETAMQSMVELDADQRWKRAIASGVSKSTTKYLPGTQVFFWKKSSSFKGRRAPQFKRWHGPGVVLGAQKAQVPGHVDAEDSYWVACGGVLYLVARQHLRPATREESLGAAVMSRIMTDMQGALREQRPMLRYIDLRRRAAEDIETADGVDIPQPAREPVVPVDGVIEAMQRQESEPDAEMAAPSTPPTESAPPGEVPRMALTDENGPEAAVPARTPSYAETVPVPESPEDMDLDTQPVSGVYELRNKSLKKGQKGKELDQRYFNDIEWEQFRAADSKQWQSHIDTGAVKVILPKDVGSIPRANIMTVPSRMVRTNQSLIPGELEAKSRWVVPGHTVPMTDGRTDAPVATQMFMHLLLSFAVNSKWEISKFDVKDAFLSGKENMYRDLYVRPPKEGIPGVPNGALIQIVKGVFGLPESPRLFWLKMREDVLSSGFEECKYLAGGFIVRNDDGSLAGMLGMHVDDGLWAGKGRNWEKASNALRAKLNFKHELRGEFELLGRRVTVSPTEVKVDQWEYIKKIKSVFVPAKRRREPLSLLSAVERTAYQSLTQQLAWPARCSMPGLAFLVSELQQTGGTPTVKSLIRANFVLGEAQKMTRAGACLRFKRWPQEELKQDKWIASIHDASWANMPNFASQQAQLTGLTTSRIVKGPSAIHLIDWGSGKIHRKVKSTMAAESATASYAYDRGVFARAIVAELLGLRPEDKWTERVREVPHVMATDCRSLVEHTNKTGSTSLTEKRVALDMSDLREGIDGGKVLLKWIATEEMAADWLTKWLGAEEQKSLHNITQKNMLSMCYSWAP